MQIKKEWCLGTVSHHVILCFSYLPKDHRATIPAHRPYRWTHPERTRCPYTWCRSNSSSPRPSWSPAHTRHRPDRVSHSHKQHMTQTWHQNTTSCTSPTKLSQIRDQHWGDINDVSEEFLMEIMESRVRSGAGEWGGGCISSWDWEDISTLRASSV